MTKTKSRDGQPAPAESAGQLASATEICQRTMHRLTRLMIAAFLLLIALTTVSTGAFVQVAGRSLYFLILAAAVASLAAWLTRLGVERRASRSPDPVGQGRRRG